MTGGDDEIGQELHILVERHGARLERVVAGVLGDLARAEDVCQEAWMSLWRSRERHDLDVGASWPLIRRIGVRKAVDELRRRQREPFSADAVEPSWEARETPVDMEAALAALPTGERASLVLFFWEGLSVREIAGALEVPDGTVKTWMHRGRRRLREALGAEENG